jgi:quercetin dioxygenase-like cupin family protein
MTYNTRFITCFLPVVFLFTASCNETAEVKEQEDRDSSSPTMATTTDNRPSYDTSRSVTSISPKLYKTLADTLNIKMLEGTYQPGDSSIMHAHPDFALYVLEGSSVELTMTDGAKQTIDFKKGMAVILPAATHSAKNIGTTRLKLIVVEVNRPRD